MRNLFLYIFLLSAIFMQAQETISGKVLDEAGQPLPGAGVQWLSNTISTTTAADGTFTLPYTTGNTQLTISYMGFVTDTITISSPQYITHKMKPDTAAYLYILYWHPPPVPYQFCLQFYTEDCKYCHDRFLR